MGKYDELVEPSNADLGDTPDSVLDYVNGLEAKVTTLQAELAAMKARGDRLAEFAVHKRECLIVKVWWQAGNCQCGLTQALTEWRDQ